MRCREYHARLGSLSSGELYFVIVYTEYCVILATAWLSSQDAQQWGYKDAGLQRASMQP